MSSLKSASKSRKPPARSRRSAPVAAAGGVARTCIVQVHGLSAKLKNRRPHNRSSAVPLFDHWPSVSRRIRQAERILLFLDFDGTLVGFRKDPKQVRLDDSTRQLLTRLAHDPRAAVGFISGRRRADLRRRVGVPAARYWGLHGWENRPGKQLGRSTRRMLVRVERELAEATAGLPGVWVQDKQASIVLHYRGAPAGAARRAVAAALRIGSAAAPRLRLLKGKKILEIMAPEIEGKGAAVTEALRKAPRGALAIYIGDDKTDEPAFAAVNHRGLAIRAGRPARTDASYRVRNPAEVKEFLTRLEAELSGSGAG